MKMAVKLLIYCHILNCVAQTFNKILTALTISVLIYT